MAQAFSIFILKPKGDSLKAAETFLKNRKWRVSTGTNLREALAHLIQKKPDFIMIPSDHPNKKVRVLPKLITQAFPVKIIGYCESSAGNSIAAMHEMGCEYTLFPPVSGPAIERIVLKIQRDEEKRKKDAEERKALGLSDDTADGTIRLKGEGFSGEQLNGSFESAREALTQLMSGEDGDAGSFVAKGDGPKGAAGGTGGGSSSGPAEGESFADWEERMRREQQARDGAAGSGAVGGMGGMGGDAGSGANSASGMAYSGNMGQSGAAGTDGSSGSLLGPAYRGGASGSSSQNGGPVADGLGAGQAHGTLGTVSPDGEGFSTNPDGPDSNPLASNEQGAKGSAPSRNPGDTSLQAMDEEATFEEGGQRRKKDAPFFEHDGRETKKRPQVRYKQDPSRQVDTDSIIVRGTQSALDESSVQLEGLGREDGSYQELKNSSHCACIIVESERFSGYLVAAMGKDRKIDESFMTMIKQKLFAFLRAHGEVLKNEESMSLKIQEVEFEDWALEQADFLRKSIHEGDEVAMAFFPTKETSIQLEESVSENMFKMDIGELKDDVAVEFDLYLYMPGNNKYLLYTPQGRPLYGDQRSRLSERGITHMHLRKESAGEVKKYRAQNYLNEKIAAYRLAKQTKTS